MNNEDAINSDEITLLDIWGFLSRQYKIIFMIFMTITTITLIYAFTKPTIYQSKASITIGEQLYFAQAQTQSLIETAEEIQYHYSSLATISPIKKTRIIEIITTANTPDIAKENLKSTIQKIISSHKAILDDKKSKFENLLTSITNSNNVNKSDFIHLIDNASTSSLTKQLTDAETKELKHGGIFIKIVGIGVFAALFISLLFATLKDYIERNRS
jgi:hypothetical protein